VLVAPVVEQGAKSRRVYLPGGAWQDFWTGERLQGGREITRPVDLETTPLYVRAGAILPFGPVKQYTAEKVDEPDTIAIYPGADGSFLLYEDDGKSFDYRKGAWMGVQMNWNDPARKLSLRLADGSRMLASKQKKFDVKFGDVTKQIAFEGKPIEVSL
jgi:alpha-glucosidase/alpha-D-xyloside xylohydrolase